MRQRIAQATIVIAALLFAAVALAVWVAPLETAERLGLAVTGRAGLTSLRTEIGGLFVGLALLCGGAAASQRRTLQQPRS